VVRAGQVPPPATVGHSCVYVVRRLDGAFYCGETDDLKSAPLCPHAGLQALWIPKGTALHVCMYT